MREQLEEVAGELDEVMVAVAAHAGATWHPWQHVEWLRLQADLLDRLGAAFGGPGSCRAELLRDRAERLADRINGMPTARDATPPDGPGTDAGTSFTRIGPPHQRARPTSPQAETHAETHADPHADPGGLDPRLRPRPGRGWPSDRPGPRST
ncbi:hypothetical protein ACFYOT_02485 [Saccharothrix saharensis]|uniref:hypothetical protein n=1 Tax=Saccharothrix saharensis TaxID=571190 RepID=UPI0036AD3F60